jgi:hypothetical protein
MPSSTRVAPVDGGTVKMGLADAQATVGADHIAPVALGTAQRLAQERDHIRPVPDPDATGEERAQHGVGQEPPIEIADGSDNTGSAADRLVDADRLRQWRGRRSRDS